VVVSRRDGSVNMLMSERAAGVDLTTSFSDDAGHDPSYKSPTGNITVDVTATNGATGADIDVTLDGPFLQSSKPTISGTPKVDRALTANPGVWETGTAFSYQWLSNGSPITGAINKTYLPTTYGRTVSVQVTGTKTGRLPARQTSAGVFIERGTFISTVQPTISGTARVGRTLRAYHGTWKPSPSSWSYQWRANGKTISGATRSYYVIPTARIGQRITVQVTGRRPGYVTRIRTSSSTAIVRR
jgi:hypothetical protein